MALIGYSIQNLGNLIIKGMDITAVVVIQSYCDLQSLASIDIPNKTKNATDLLKGKYS